MRSGLSHYTNTADDGLQVREDILLHDAEDAPPEGSERTISSRILPGAVLVVGAVNLDGEADLGAGEVHDEVSDDELTPEGKACL